MKRHWRLISSVSSARPLKWSCKSVLEPKLLSTCRGLDQPLQESRHAITEHRLSQTEESFTGSAFIETGPISPSVAFNSCWKMPRHRFQSEWPLSLPKWRHLTRKRTGITLERHYFCKHSSNNGSLWISNIWTFMLYVLMQILLQLLYIYLRIS